jgi:hypothetical protein
MKSHRVKSALRLTLAAAAALAVTATTARAQYGRQQQQSRVEVLEWRGQVDREIQIQVDNRQASVIEMGSNERARRRVNMLSGIPNRPGRLYVQRIDGRGDVDVIQQPSQSNGYRATIRIRDPKGGADRYRIAVYWESTGRWNNGRNH